MSIPFSEPNELVVAKETMFFVAKVVKKGKYRGTRDVAVKTMNTGTMREDDFIDEARTMM